MGDLLTYNLSDFMLFSPATFFRQFELYNEALWPLHLAAVAWGAYILKMFLFDGARKDLQSLAFIAIPWFWVAFEYFANRHAEINLAANYFAGAFAVQSIMFIVAEYTAKNKKTDRPAGHLRKVGGGFILFGVFLYPLSGYLAGRPWMQAEIFGVVPDPTVCATLGFLLVAPRWRGILLVIPLAWCAITGAMRFAMEAPDFWLMPAAGFVALVLVIQDTNKRRVRSI